MRTRLFFDMRRCHATTPMTARFFSGPASVTSRLMAARFPAVSASTPVKATRASVPVLCTPMCTPVRSFASTSSLWARMRGGQVTPNYTPETTSGTSNMQEALTPEVRAHLTQVYNRLALGVGVAAVGAAAMIMTPLGAAIPYWLPLFGGFVPLLWLMFAPPANPVMRQALFFTFTLIEGMALAPIIKMTAAAGVLGTALVLTGAVFVGFSAAAFLAPRASMLALQGPLYGMLIGMVAISVLNMFYPTAFAHSLILYGGLALFSVFVAVDTQAMIERARCGMSDPTMDALGMFMNVVNIFVRIAEILRSMSE